jgi:hypothetical protein
MFYHSQSTKNSHALRLTILHYRKSFYKQNINTKFVDMFTNRGNDHINCSMLSDQYASYVRACTFIVDQVINTAPTVCSALYGVIVLQQVMQSCSGFLPPLPSLPAYLLPSFVPSFLLSFLPHLFLHFFLFPSILPSCLQSSLSPSSTIISPFPLPSIYIPSSPPLPPLP